jgi:hypothetical protein
LKTKILDPKTISDDTIKTILDSAAIDHHDNGGIYVTNYSTNFWLEVDQKRKLLIINTYWKVQPDVDELDILRFVSQANSNKIMLQFSYSADLGRFYGHYSHPYSVGLIPTQVLKLCQKFSSIFEEVVHEGVAESVLQQLPDCSMDTGDDAGVAESTVH